MVLVNKKRTRITVVASAAIIGVLAVGTPAFAGPVYGGSVSCGPDQQVKIATTNNGTYTVHTWVPTGGTSAVPRTYNSGGSHTTYTGSRSISSWSANSDGRFSSYGAACA